MQGGRAEQVLRDRDCCALLLSPVFASLAAQVTKYDHTGVLKRRMAHADGGVMPQEGVMIRTSLFTPRQAPGHLTIYND